MTFFILAYLATGLMQNPIELHAKHTAEFGMFLINPLANLH